MFKVQLILVLLFFSQHSSALSEFPKNCLQSDDVHSASVCHFGTVKKQARLEIGAMTIFMANETLLKKENEHIEWIQGTVLLDISTKTEIVYRSLPIALQKGHYLIFGNEDKLSVDVLEGNFLIGKVHVTEGFQGSFSVLNSELQVEPLQAINLKEHLSRYAEVKKLNKEETAAYLEEFQPKHVNYLEWATELNKSLYKRSLATAEQNDKQKKQAHERASLSLEKQKKAFFDKVFER